MKQYVHYFISIFLAFAAFSCSEQVLHQDEALTIDDESDYDRSKSQWLILKDQNGDSYDYTIQTISWTGYGTRTSLQVNNGEVVSRSFEAFQQSHETGDEEILETYNETVSDLGSHEEGAPVLTIDELYEICASEYLVVDASENTIYFETDDQGLLSTCGFVPKGCMDDCYIGLSISEFSWL